VSIVAKLIAPNQPHRTWVEQVESHKLSGGIVLVTSTPLANQVDSLFGISPC
jgi:hypothetical protein